MHNFMEERISENPLKIENFRKKQQQYNKHVNTAFVASSQVGVYLLIDLFIVKLRHSRYMCGVLNLIKLLMGNTFRRRKKTQYLLLLETMFVCAYVCAKERSGYPAYAEYSKNIHNAFGEQGREKAPGIQFRM